MIFRDSTFAHDGGDNGGSQAFPEGEDVRPGIRADRATSAKDDRAHGTLKPISGFLKKRRLRLSPTFAGSRSRLDSGDGFIKDVERYLDVNWEPAS
jgi:hypothetical protein